MGIEVSYRRLKQTEFERIQHDPKERDAFLGLSLPGIDVAALMKLAQNPDALRARGPEILAAYQKRGDDPTRVDLQKDWHALHFLLTGDSSMEIEHRTDDPIHNVVMGGHETSLETGYGPVRSFTVEEVRAIAAALSKISVEELRSRFSADSFNSAEIYPNPRPGGWDERQVGYVYHIFPKLVRFFEEAASADEIVAVYAT